VERSCRKTEGVSLIELMVALTVVAILALVTVEYQRQKQLQGTNQTREAQASSLMREFFDLRKKRIACVPSGGDLTVVPAAGAPSAGGTNLARLEFPTQNKSGVQFREIISNSCVTSPTGTPPLPAIPDCDNQGSENPICPAGQIPFVRIQATGNINSIEFFPPAALENGNPVVGTGLNGLPLGAAVCMRINGTPDNYRDVHFDLFAYVVMGNRTVKVVRQQVNIPRPKITNASSVVICP